MEYLQLLFQQMIIEVAWLNVFLLEKLLKILNIKCL